MADFASHRAEFDSLHRPQPSTSNRRASSPPTPPRRKNGRLPEGPCNYRDLTAGPKPPGCGCRRFWLGPTLGRIGLGLSQSPEPWCACGHHACFHERKEASKGGEQSAESSLTGQEWLSQGHESVVRQQDSEPTQPWPDRGIRPPAQLDVVLEHHHAAPVLVPMPSGQPQIPSFHLTSSELRGYTNYNGSVGLGLDFQQGIHAARKFSQSPTVPDGASMVDDLPSTRQPSTEDRISPSGVFMRHILNARQEAHLLDTNGASKAPIGLGFGDLIQSATEVATPSISDTPKLTGAVQLMQEAADVVGILEQGLAAAGEDHTRTSIASNVSQHGSHTNERAISSQHASPSTQTIRDALRQIPAALQRLAPLLGSLHSHVSRNPDVSIHESINSLVRRMDALENASFNQLPPEQVHEQFQHIDVRMSDLEARTDEHGRMIAALDPDSDRSASPVKSKKILSENASFTSHISGQSLNSATSSALIAAAIDRVEATERLKAVEQRLDILEAMQMPSTANPWEVEVVLLPWGRDLRGIWYSAIDLHKSAAMQDDEDWTQARGGKSSSRGSIPIGTAGWDDHTIRDWANESEEILRPKACGVNGIVYHRLRSRGLVRQVTLTSPGARDFVVTLSKAFGELLETISRTDGGDAMDEDSDEGELIGLTAPFLPLRKVHKSSCLRFLTEAELITPTLWTAEFLTAGVLMRAPGRQKRLFITTRTGYTQGGSVGWTWSGLRQLPRVHDPDSQPTAGEVVPEADALEPCWKYHPAIDSPPSAQSPFHSNIDDSGYVEARALTQASQSAGGEAENHTMDEPGSSPRMHQPITPISEFPPTQASHYHRRKSRTISTSLSDAPFLNKAKTGSLPQPTWPISQQSKRRIRSFEQAANSALIAALPTFVSSPAKGSIRSARIKKRRRITRSKSVSSAELATQSSGQIDAQSLHPEADPEQVLRHLQDVIPHGGEIKPLSYFEPRSRDGVRQFSALIEENNFDHSTGRALSERAAEKRGITPSAYATPFSGTVAGVGDQDDDYMPSESGEDDWAGVDEDQMTSNTDEHEIDDDMSDDESEGSNGPGLCEDDEVVSDDELHGDEDEDDDRVSSEDELQLGL